MAVEHDVKVRPPVRARGRRRRGARRAVVVVMVVVAQARGPWKHGRTPRKNGGRGQRGVRGKKRGAEHEKKHPPPPPSKCEEGWAKGKGNGREGHKGRGDEQSSADFAVAMGTKRGPVHWTRDSGRRTTAEGRVKKREPVTAMTKEVWCLTAEGLLHWCGPDVIGEWERD